MRRSVGGARLGSPALAVAATGQRLFHALRPLLSYLALSIGASPAERFT